MRIPQHEFIALQKEWYSRLRQDGFDNLEIFIGDRLTFDTNKTIRHRIAKVKESKVHPSNYFFEISKFIGDDATRFRDEIDKYILERFSEGLRIKEIILELHALGVPRDRKTIRTIVRRYEHQWNVRRYSDRELHRTTHQYGSRPKVIHQFAGAWSDSVVEEIFSDEVTREQKIPSSYKIIMYPSGLLPDQYRNMVLAKWLRSLRYGNPLYKNVEPQEYYKNYQTFIENMLKKPDSNIRLAVLSDDHDVVLGFSVHREDVLDYIYIGPDYRKLKIACKLFPDGTTTFTHITKSALEIWQNNPKYKELKFNPFA